MKQSSNRISPSGVFVLALLIRATSAHASGVVNSLVADFPERTQTAEACAALNSVDLSNPEIHFIPSHGASSAYAKLVLPGAKHPAGIFLPPNSSGVIDAEVVTYRLAMLLHHSRYVQPARLKSIEGDALARFHQFMLDTIWPNERQMRNRARILVAIDDAIRDHRPFFGALKCIEHKPHDFDELVVPESESLNLHQPLAHWIRAEDSKPSANETVTFEIDHEVRTAKQLTLAKTLSTQLLIDAMVGQWDRFSGGNLQATFSLHNHFSLAFFDNGGGWGELRFVDLNLSFVTRFERSVAETILALDRTVNGDKKFHGADEVGVKIFLQMHEDFETSHWLEFKQNLKRVAEHITSVQAPDADKYFERN